MTYNLSQIKLSTDQDFNRILIGKIAPSWETYWSYKGHTVGQCYTQGRVAYINIPKCASSFLKDALNWEKRCFDNMNQRVADPLYYTQVDHIMVVMRDPYDRWLSGIAEYFELYFPNDETVFEFLDFPHAQRFICDRVSFDDHTESQLFFLQNVPLDKCVFFKMNAHLGTKVHEFLDSQGITNTVNTAPPKNSTAKSSYKGRIVSKINSILRNDLTLYKQVLAYMQDDYDFMDQYVWYWGD